MRKRIKDTDYLAISSRIRAMENKLLTTARMEQLLDAHSDEEAAKLLQECGYPALDARHPEAMDAALSVAREETLLDLGDGAPDARYIEIFKLKYDYHNIKALLKAAAMNADPAHMLMDMGRVPCAVLREALESGDTEALPTALASAIAEAREVLDTTRDPQLCDIVLDRCCYEDMLAVAETIGSAFLLGYVQAQIDAANLRSLVRTLRMGKSADFLRSILLPGGVLPTDAVAALAENPGGLEELYGSTRLADAAKAGGEALRGGALTEFEKRCDDAVSAYLSGARMVPFGEAPMVAYLAARETEYTNLRILLLGRSTGLDSQVIRSRLRTSCV